MAPPLLQGRQALVGGVGRATEEEEDIDPALAREALRDPSKLMSTGSDLINNLLKCALLSARTVTGCLPTPHNGQEDSGRERPLTHVRPASAGGLLSICWWSESTAFQSTDLQCR